MRVLLAHPSPLMHLEIDRRDRAGIIHGPVSVGWSPRSMHDTAERPGALERGQDTGCPRLVGCHLLVGAGYRVQQEQAPGVSELLLDFVQDHAA
jgi:hypothetical protein